MSNLTDSRLQELAAVADGRAVLYGYENHHEATPDTQLSKARDTAAAIRELLDLRQLLRELPRFPRGAWIEADVLDAAINGSGT